MAERVLAEIDASLRRLGTDHVDLDQIHRWDGRTPVEEALEALHDVVKAGKVRYLGASSMFAWKFCKVLYLADLRGGTRFVSMQNHYNLLYRQEEREILGLCRAEGVGVLPWNPLARGRLARDWPADGGTPRAATDEYGRRLYGGTEDADRRVVERVGEVAAARGVPRAQVALAWLLHQPAVTAPVVSARPSPGTWKARSGRWPSSSPRRRPRRGKSVPSLTPSPGSATAPLDRPCPLGQSLVVESEQREPVRSAAALLSRPGRVPIRYSGSARQRPPRASRQVGKHPWLPVARRSTTGTSPGSERKNK